MVSAFCFSIMASVDTYIQCVTCKMFLLVDSDLISDLCSLDFNCDNCVKIQSLSQMIQELEG